MPEITRPSAIPGPDGGLRVHPVLTCIPTATDVSRGPSHPLSAHNTAREALLRLSTPPSPCPEKTSGPSLTFMTTSPNLIEIIHLRHRSHACLYLYPSRTSRSNPQTPSALTQPVPNSHETSHQTPCSIKAMFTIFNTYSMTRAPLTALSSRPTEHSHTREYHISRMPAFDA